MPPFLRAALSLLLLAASALEAGPVQVLEARSDQLVLQCRLSAPHFVHVQVGGRTFDDLTAPGYPRLSRPGQPALPFVAELLAVPPGARVRLEIQEAHYREFSNISFVPVTRSAATGEDAPPIYRAGSFAPESLALSEYLGIVRGVPAHALRLYPFHYDAGRRVLRVYDRLRLRVRFEGAARAAPGGARRDAELYKAFLNPPPAGSFPAPAARPAPRSWYDPSAPWVKIFVDQDGLYRIDADWLRRRRVEVERLDPRTLRLFYLGEEQFVRVRGQEDGRFDPGDELIFHGRFRRDPFVAAPETGPVELAAEKDFESLYGRRNTYWLTWGGDPGKRFVERSGAPLNNYPQQRSFWSTAHFEKDLKFEQLGSAPDNQRDHWFWAPTQLPITSRRPERPSSASFFGDLVQADSRTNYSARIRASLQGLTPAHHTILKINGNDFDERIWGGGGKGQIELLVEKDIPAAWLKTRAGDERNRILVQVIADQDKTDAVYFNWFEIDYRRLYRAQAGYLAFEQPPSEGHRIALAGFSSPRIELYDLAGGVRFTQMDIEQAGGAFFAIFEDRHRAPASYVAADSLSIKTPLGLLDRPSNWRSPAQAADYVIVAPGTFAEALRPLAEHRRQGLEVALVEVQDLFDEFSFGRFDAEAVRAFVDYAYHNWARRPAYLLLVGSTHWDSRNILGGGRPNLVPTLFYQSRGRGHSPSDFLYSLVDGDDLLPDLAVGRLPVENAREARRAVERIIRYDRQPPSGPWRSRAIFLANDQKDNFIRPSNALATLYTEPLGLKSIKIYNDGDPPIPNADGRAFLDALNEGGLMVNFNGHGSANLMISFFTIAFPEYDYLSQVQNGARLPLIVGLSCLNDQFANPLVESLGEVLTTLDEGGAIAYISASAKSFVAQNILLSDRLFNQVFKEGALHFGPALNAAKIQTLSAHPSWITSARTMQLMGDPAQELSLPQAADYEPVSLRTDTGELFSRTTAGVELTLRNNARLAGDSLTVVLLARALESARSETLLLARRPAFAGTQSLHFDWALGERRGPYRLQVLLDPENGVPELDESNNRLSLALEIREPLVPAPLFPAAAAVVEPGALSLEALVHPELEQARYEFALSTEAGFAPARTVVSPPIQAAGGVAAFAPPVQSGQSYFWRVRTQRGRARSPWSPTRSFRAAAGAAPRWRQQGRQLLLGESLDLEPDAGGGLSLSAAARPFRPSAQTREEGFTVREFEQVRGAGVLATDGAFLYVKRWFNNESTVYPGSDFFARIGTGFEGTPRGGLVGFLSDRTTAGISATYHSDGYIYNESGRAFELERISAASGRLDTVQVPEGLLEWQSGRVEDGHSLITSDGRYIYNVSMSTPRGAHTGWSVRVFDPARGWTLVRQFTSPPTETGFSFQWTDGILADGEHLYFIEFKGRRRIRMVDAFDGTFLDEWTSDQEQTRIIGGQYDWVHNKVWLGDLQGPGLFRYSGLKPVSAGRLTSAAIGPAARWKSLRLQGAARGGARLRGVVLGRDQAGRWTPLPGFEDLPPEVPVDLSGLDAARYPRIRLEARLQGARQELSLDAWEVDFVPAPALQVRDAQAALDSSGLHVQLAVRNLSSESIAGARLLLERGDRELPLLEVPLAPLRRGELRFLRLDSLALPPADVRLFARVLTRLPDADPSDNRIEIPLLFAGRLPLRFRLWPEGNPFLDGDPLRRGQSLLIEAPALAGSRLELRLDGAPVEADSVLAASFPDPPGRRIFYRPPAAPGPHTLQVRLLSRERELGVRRIRFVSGAALAIANPLLYPHPVSGSTAFTYVLSRGAEVNIEIYSLSGRLVQRLGPLTQGSGFQQVDWDGRDLNGHHLANGAYLYRIAAVDSDGKKAEVRRPLSIAR